MASAIAAYGLALDNVIVVFGAMMLAPILSPFVSSAISLVVGDRSMMKEALGSGFFSVVISVLVAFFAVLPFSVNMNPTLELVVSSSILSVLLSILVGVAAALSFATGYRDQIAGVAVAIAIVPPLASVGIGIKMQDIVFAVQAAKVAFINILAVLISGFATFRVLGLGPSTYYRKKQAREIVYVVPVALVIFALLAAPSAYSTYKGYQEYRIEQEIEDSALEQFGSDMLDIRFDESQATIILLGQHDTEQFKEQFDSYKIDIREIPSQ